MGFDEKMKIALCECRGIWIYDIDRKFKYIYPFTTENQAVYMPTLDLAGKTMLTVGSSNDQVLNAISLDCRNIIVYDICPFTLDYYNLKKAALKALSREEYIIYFAFDSYKNRTGFNKKTYQKIREALVSISDESTCFWDTLYKKYSGPRIHRRLFTTTCQEFPPSELNTYLSDDDHYQYLRDRIDNAQVIFKYEDIFKANFDMPFDVANLSNLVTYYNPQLILELFNKTYASINDNGTIMICYLYEIDKETILHNPDSNPAVKDLMSVLPSNAILYSFSSVYKGELSDTIVTYKKVKKI